ncbi:MAG: DUF3426 domain-containing protein [Burkholderiaceae bacterium]
MTLATTCPHCKTSFKVVADQLKLRKGLVRCGRCQQVFSGVDALTYLDDAGESQDTAPLTEAPSSDPSDIATAASLLTLPEADSPSEPPRPQTAAVSERPALETVPMSALPTPETVSAPIPLASDPVPSWAQPDSDQTSEPAPRTRSGRVAALLAILACLGLLGQSVIGLRHELAYRVPVLAPLLEQMAHALKLDLHPPLDASSLSIESIELAAAEDPSKLALEAVIRNRSDRPVAFPAIELTLRDTQSVMLVRKIIEAEIYTRGPERLNGLAARSEHSERGTLEHDGLAVAGYVAFLFYP